MTMIAIMFKLLVILYAFKLYVYIDIFKQIKKKHGQNIFNIVKNYGQLKSKLMKIQAEITFIKTRKVEHLTSTFANVKLATWPRNKKLKMKISCIIIETELQHNHCEKRKS